MNLAPGPHLLAAPSPQAGAPGSQFAFAGWSDSGAETHSIDVTGTAETYIASFTTQYQLTTATVPSGGGAVTPASGSFYNAGSTVNLTATGAAPYTFSYWSGAASGNTNSTSITMSAAESVTANFVSCAITGDRTASVADVQLIINEALGAARAVNDMNHDGVINVADVEILIDAALGWY